MLKGPERSFVVLALVALVLGAKSKAKNVSNGTKNVREQNLFQIEQRLLLKEQKMFVNENRVKSENITALYFSFLSIFHLPYSYYSGSKKNKTIPCHTIFEKQD